jgi:hydroxymethylbilane synthase
VSRTLRIGARGSSLSMWQVHHAIELLHRRGVPVELVVLSSSGDRDRNVAIEDLPSAAPFADDLEDALKAGTIDVAVHSLKDLALVPSAGLVVSALLPRGPVTESLVSRNHLRFDELPRGAVIGTCSSRRQAQVHLRRPDLVCRPIRGPVDDRVDQVRAGRFDAAILATAGLERLRLSDAITETFSASDFVPAAGQGALALQVRATDAEARALTASLDHFATRLATTAELGAERHLGSAGQLPPQRGCRAGGPVAAAHAFARHAFIALHVRLLSRDGGEAVNVMASGTDPDRVALDAAERAVERWAVAR